MARSGMWLTEVRGQVSGLALFFKKIRNTQNTLLTYFKCGTAEHLYFSVLATVATNFRERG